MLISLLFLFFLFMPSSFGAMDAHVGQFAQPTSADSSYAVTGTGFTPELIMLYGNGLTADGSQANKAISIGFGVSSSSRFVASGYTQSALNNGRSSVGRRSESHIHSIEKMTSDAYDDLVLADLVSLDSDGFTLNFSVADATARKINYLALGGDITNVKIGKFASNTSTGSQAVTGVGFQPDSVIFLNHLNSASTGTITGTFYPTRVSLGYATDATHEATTFQHSYQADAASYQSASSSYGQASGNESARQVNIEAQMTSMDADGFTVNVSTAPATALYIFYVAIKGGQFDVGSFNQATSSGTDAITGVGFTPTGIVMQSQNVATTSTVQSGSIYSLGAASSTTARYSMIGAAYEQSSGSNSITADHLDSSSVIRTSTFSPISITADGDLNSFDSDGFTMNWISADATAREINYFAVGSTGGAPPATRRIFMVT